MSRDKALGTTLTLASAAIIVAYAILVFNPPNWHIMGMKVDLFLLKLTGFIAVAGVFGILAWVGYTLATTPPPKPIEEIEKELEEELKRLERETRQEGAKGTEPGGNG